MPATLVFFAIDDGSDVFTEIIADLDQLSPTLVGPIDRSRYQALRIGIIVVSMVTRVVIRIGIERIRMSTF